IWRDATDSEADPNRLATETLRVSSSERLKVRVALVLLLFVASPSSPAAVREVGAIGLTVGDLDRALVFYTKELPFEKVSESKTAPGAADKLLGLSSTQLRIAELKLGDERITLTEHLTNKGRG